MSTDNRQRRIVSRFAVACIAIGLVTLIVSADVGALLIGVGAVRFGALIAWFPPGRET